MKKKTKIVLILLSSLLLFYTHCTVSKQNKKGKKSQSAGTNSQQEIGFGTSFSGQNMGGTVRPKFGFIVANLLENFASEDKDVRCSHHSWTSPFMLSNVRSLLYEDGDCYNSLVPSTWEHKAKYLHGIGADFVIADLTNLAKSQYPNQNKEWTSFKAMIQGFDDYSDFHIKIAPMVSMTSYATFDHKSCVGKNGITDKTEVLTLTPELRAHFRELKSMSQGRRNAFLIHEGKPTLLVYLNSGNGVKTCDGRHAFNGPYHLIPSEQQMQEMQEFKIDGIPLTDFFTLRFLIVPTNQVPRNLSEVDNRIWPFANTFGEHQMAETGWLSLTMGAPLAHRSPNHFLSLHQRQPNKEFYLVNCFSYYASLGDEVADHSCTIEPNTMLNHYDESNDPWEYYDFVRSFIWGTKGGIAPPIERHRIDPSEDNMMVGLNFLNSLPDLIKGHVLSPEFGLECVNLSEPADSSKTWHDNYLCHQPAKSGYRMSWSYDGEIPGQHCIPFNEPSDDGSWQDNFLCFDHPVALEFSNNGRIPGQYCVRIFEPGDQSWTDNFLCSPHKFFNVANGGIREPASDDDDQIEFKFAFSFDYRNQYLSEGYDCLQMLEPSDPHTWDDNFLCYKGDPKRWNLSWSYNGALAGRTCLRIYEESDPHTWNDNFLCGDQQVAQLRWSQAGPVTGYCVQINEPSDPHTWNDNYLCW